MASNALIALELVLVLGLALGWGFWELWSLRRERRRADEARRKGSGDPPEAG